MNNELDVHCYECDADYVVISDNAENMTRNKGPNFCTYCGSVDVEITNLGDDDEDEEFLDTDE